ncbi:unnamed protein product [Amoebophrya sp. A25]|nr:unnamed protein product [Amoebophrya sp. A25]|eukprot:GSA25T00022065001.1
MAKLGSTSVVPGPLQMPQMAPLPGIQGVKLNVSTSVGGLQSPSGASRASGESMPSMQKQPSAAMSASAQQGVLQTAIPQAVVDSGNMRLANQWERATNACTSIDSMLATLAELYEVNSFWKEKYIASKKEHFSKYMNSSASGLVTSCFQSWKGYTFETFSDRKLDGKREDIDQLHKDCQALMDRREDALQKKLAAMEARHEQALSEMGGVIDKQNHQISNLQFDINDIIEKTDTAKGMMKQVRGAIMGVPESEYKVSDPDSPDPHVKPHANSFDYTKQTLHDLLNEVDPKYVPPVGSLCVGPPPAPIGSPLLVRKVDYQGHDVLGITASRQ